MGGGKPSPFLTMEKIEIYKKVKENYDVILFMDHTVLEEGLSEHKKSNSKNIHWVGTNHSFNTSEEFMKHYANKLARVFHHKTTIVIEKNGDKLSFKVFRYNNERRQGVHYFKKTRSMSFFTLNLKTGVLYQGEITGLHRKKKNRKIRTNFFHQNPISLISDSLYWFVDSSVRMQEFESLRDLFLSHIPDFPLSDDMLWEDHEMGLGFYRYYLQKKGVSIPDNFTDIQHCGYEGIVPSKFFKKGKNKFIDSLMLYHGFSGDVIKKALHTKNRFTFNTLKSLISLVGSTRVQQDYDLMMHYLCHPNNILIPYDVSWITEAERKRIWAVIKGSKPRMLVIRDHIEFIVFLRKKNIDQKWESKTYKEFIVEHKKLSDEVAKFKKGIFNRKYPDEFYSTFKEPITVTIENSEPITYSVNILSEQDEYYQESEHQQNCVKTYLMKPGSFILSIRNKEDRATVEYQIKSIKNTVNVYRTQSLGRFNKELDPSWDNILKIVDEMVNNLISKTGYEIVLTKEKKDKVTSYTTTFNEYGFVTWDKPLELVSDFDYFF